MQVKSKDGTDTAGRVIIRRYKPGTLARYLYHKKTSNTDAEFILKNGFIGVAVDCHNLVVSSSGHGRNIIARRLGGDTTYTGIISHGEIGTGSTPPTNTDTDLTTPSIRVAPTQAVIVNNVVTIRFFFSDAALPNNTYNEFGTFIDGNASLGTGQMFNHSLFDSAYVKASSEDTTVDVEFTLT